MKKTTYDGFKERYGTADDAATYRDQRFARSRRWQWIDAREQEVVRRFLAGLGEGAWVLDVPCGTGRLAPLVAEAGCRYVGADVALPMLELAHQSLGASASLTAADALDLPLGAGAVDAVMSVRLFHRITEREGRVAMLREMARVSSGPILTTYYLSGNLRGLKKRLAGKFAGLSLAAIREDARQAELAITAIEPLGRWTHQQCFIRFEKR